ncbi:MULTISPECIES: hypothetical protein [Rhizobium]|uniref:Uncharacterized protein n=1 Tax=Rhizobium etli TaxID=29449 RepID=A0A7W6VF73_RHIET|nr:MULTISPECIES: hypothetical protein [Rhizobium]MBB4483209.1 hypothetical protein [Rhizobium etli]MBB4539037.1 hypothetical protein [Rhizobium etli]PDT07430.1 hypothetical protein CO655_26905 [Rhizobium sp. M1]
MNKHVKIDTPDEETVVLGGRTLREIVALMDRLKGMLQMIDISVGSEGRKALYTHQTHFRANTPENQQWTMQNLTCDAVDISKAGKPFGRTIWDMYIAHDLMPKGSRVIRGKRITSANLSDAISRIHYVIAPDHDVTADVDNAERVIASYEARLAHIGEWIRLGMYMQVECGCGHSATFRAREVFKGIPGDRATSEVVKRLMRCKTCGFANEIEAIPLNSRGELFGPHTYTDNDMIRWDRGPIVLDAKDKDAGREDQFYTDLGGNGEDPVFVGDGLYMDPDGKLRDF